MSGSFVSMQWNACMRRLDLGLYSHPKSCWGMESEPMLTPREKSLIPEKFSVEEEQTNDDASSKTLSPTRYQRAIPDRLEITLPVGWALNTNN